MAVTKEFIKMARSSFDPVIRLYHYYQKLAQGRYSAAPAFFQLGSAIMFGGIYGKRGIFVNDLLERIITRIR